MATFSRHDAASTRANTSQSRPLRVLVVAPSMETIGGQSVQADLILRRQREEPSLEMSFQPIDPKLPRHLRALQQVKYARTLATLSIYYPEVFRAVRKCDVVHVFSASYWSFLLAPTPAIYFARYFHKPVILNYHSGEAEDHLTRWPSAVRSLRLANRIVVPSDYLVRIFRRFGLQAHVVFNAVELDAFKFRARPKPRPAFLVNRNFEAHYNVGGVLQAFALIQRQLPDASLTVAGMGPQQDHLRQLSSTLSLRNVRFVGRIRPENMPAVYEQHDVWLNASLVDNMPLSILEAYASGLGVVTSNAGGIPDIVEHNRTGKIVVTGDYVTLANQALDLVSRPSLFAEFTRNGRMECDRYAWESVKSSWMAMYSDLAPNGTLTHI